MCHRVAAARIYAPDARQSAVVRLHLAGQACGRRLLLVYPLARTARATQPH